MPVIQVCDECGAKAGTCNCYDWDDEVKKGDRIVIHTDEGDKIAKCTGVTHDNLIHFMRYENSNPVAGFVGRRWVEKVNE